MTLWTVARQAPLSMGFPVHFIYIYIHNILYIKISSELKNILDMINKILLYNFYVTESVLTAMVVYKNVNM